MLPNHLQDEFDKLTPFQKEKFYELAAWSNYGPPGTSMVTDASYGIILETVRRMEDHNPPVEEKKEE